MKYSSKQYAQALFEALQGSSPSDSEKVLDNFVKILAENNDIKLFERISEEFHQLDLAQKGIKLAQVTSAKPISSGNEKEIVATLNTLLKSKVELKKSVDENLVGGVVIKVDDLLIDASVKNSLTQLKQDLSNN